MSSALQKVNAGDKQAQYLEDKLTSLDNSVTFAVNTDVNGVRTLDLSASGGGGSDIFVKVRSSDTTANYLRSKVTSGDASITFAIVNPGGNEVLDIRAVSNGGSTQLLTPQQFSNGELIADGSSVSLTSLGYSQGAANAAWPLTAADKGGNIPLSMTIDTASVYECILSTEDEAFQSAIYYGCYKGNEYVINFELPLIKTTTKISTNFVHNYDGCTMRWTHAGSLYHSSPANQTEADAIVARTFSFSNGTFQGPGNDNDGSMAFEIGATVYTNFTNCYVSGCDYGWNMKYALFSQWINCAGIGCAINNWRLSSGNWTGASLSNSQCNDSDFFNCRNLVSLNTTEYGMRFYDSSDINLFGCTCEGGESGTQANQPLGGIYFDDNNSTVVKGINIDGLHVEQSYTRAMIELHGREGTYTLKDIFPSKQGIYSNNQNTNYFWVQTNAGVMKTIVNSLLYATPYMTFYNHNQLNHWWFNVCEIINTPLTKYQLQVCQNNNSLTIWNNAVPDDDKVFIVPVTEFAYVQSPATPITTGSTITLAIEKTVLIIRNGAIAALTINMPQGAHDGDSLDIIFQNTVTILTFTGTTVISPLGAIAATRHIRLTYSAQLISWV